MGGMSRRAVEPFRALALQVTCQAVNALTTVAAARAAMAASIDRIGRQIKASKAFIGPDLKLIVLPEYFLTGFPMGESILGWVEKACLEVGGPEYQALGQAAKASGVFVSGNVYELDAHFPGLYFQTSFVIDPSGAVVLRYRRLNSMFAPTPHDVWDRYREIYGMDGIFPVADTEIGRLAAIASEEILYPEIARSLVLRGAEILLHSSSETGSPLQTQKNVAKLARAIESMAYVISANSAGIAGNDIPMASTDGGSKIVDFTGHVLAEASPGESMVAQADIDIAALRRYRRRPGMNNFLARQRLELFAETYDGSIYPANSLLNGDGEIVVPQRRHFTDTQAEVIAKLDLDGTI